ncbi:hypothetical protein [Confluentibacter sediminis]|uniref:hypothetical protein n=1 Tax=Confluentibacter sediminis TaxID=2219045 RepID=UPI000DABCDC3|nr:hypothetical protein [Confluentibacter sediminis]
MKQGLVLFTLLSYLTIIVACTSNNDDHNDNQLTDYYFKFTIDGTPISYNLKPDAQVNLTGSYVSDEHNQLYAIQITGSSDIFKPNENQFVIYLNDSSEFTISTTYSNSESPDTETPFYFVMGYYDKNGEIFTASLNSPALQLWENCYVKFDEITESGIKGTFSGDLLRYDTSSGKNLLAGSVHIEDGKFHVPRNNE